MNAEHPAVTVDAEFAATIRPLEADEKRELEAAIVEHGGARDALVVWDVGDGAPPILLDGHNRLKICRRLGLPFALKALSFATRNEAAAWMRRNQLGRRNLSRNAFLLLLGDVYNQTKAAGRWESTRPGRRADDLAREHGLGEKTVRRAGKFRDAAEKLGLVDEIASGKIKATVDSLIAVAESLPARPTAGQIRAAVAGGLSRVSVRNNEDFRRRPESQSWLLPADPAECLKAVDFYARSFFVRAPRDVDALRRLLERLIAESSEYAAKTGSVA